MFKYWLHDLFFTEPYIHQNLNKKTKKLMAKTLEKVNFKTLCEYYGVE